VAHNHPSGASSPSEHDVELTKAVYDAGQIVGINLLDHLVIGEKDYYSFAQNRPELLGRRS
jgi:DNA repair protein RadC